MPLTKTAGWHADCLNHFILYNSEKAREKRVGVTYSLILILTGLYLLKFIFMLAYVFWLWLIEQNYNTRTRSLFLGNYNLSTNIRLIIYIKLISIVGYFNQLCLDKHPISLYAKKAHNHVTLLWFESKRTFVSKAI